MNSLQEYDFRKAAASASNLKRTDAEIAFYRASSTIIEDKAAPFFTSDYYLGFEIVKTNDAYTKMVGIYVFRVNKKLFYVPVFYIDGKIKGTDFLYNVTEKKFVYLSPEWCDYFIGLYEEDLGGTPITKDEANKGHQDIEMLRIATPLYKTGSTIQKFAKDLGMLSSEESDNLKSFEETYKDMFMEFINTPESSESPLHAFFKSAGYKAWEKMADAMKKDHKFAAAVSWLCNEEDYIPTDVIELEKENNIKLAKSKKPVQDLVVLHGGRFNSKAKDHANQIKYGYSFEDNRNQEDLGSIYDSANEADEEFTGITSNGPGVYDILTTDGSFVKCIAVAGNSDFGKAPALLISLDPKLKGIISYSDLNSPKELYSEAESAKAPGSHDDVIGVFRDIVAKQEKDIDKANEEINKVFKSKPEAGKLYGIWDPYYSYLSDESFYVESVEGSDNKYTVKAYPANGYENFKPWETLVQGKDMIIKVNPTINAPMYELKVFKPEVRWIELPFEKIDLAKKMKDSFNIDKEFSFKKNDLRYDIIQADFVPGNWENLYDNQKYLDSNVVGSATIGSGAEDNTFDLDLNGNKYAGLNKIGIKAMLMVNANLSEDTVDYAIKRASINFKSRKPYRFLFKKFADRIILNPEPEFFEGFDSDLNIPYQIPETRVLMTDETSYSPPAPRYGDMMNPTVMESANTIEPSTIKPESEVNGFLETATPNMLAEFANRSGKKNLFEHGVISVLSQVSDAQTYVNEFIPSLRNGMDNLARLLFLILISPQNFVKYYGTDDLRGLENSVALSFKQLSELTLNLIQKVEGVASNLTSRG